MAAGVAPFCIRAICAGDDTPVVDSVYPPLLRDPGGRDSSGCRYVRALTSMERRNRICSATAFGVAGRAFFECFDGRFVDVTEAVCSGVQVVMLEHC